MARPTFWNQKTRLYAFGNTPAFSLAEHVAPDEPAAFLQLGSGDARNVLYTVYAAALDAPNASGARVFDFTCVDIEPAVLARNALLYAMLADDPTLKNIDKIWNFYYDMKIDQATLKYLYSYCAKLVEASVSITAWAASPFANFMRVSTEHSLSELRRLWSLFLSTREDPSIYKERLRVGMTHTLADSRKSGPVLSIIHAAGPLWMSAVQRAVPLYETYWTTGLSIPLSEARMKTMDANPTLLFALSGEPFPLHPVAMPCLGFHLAEALAAHENPSIQDIYATVQAQFRAWAGAFAMAVASRKVVVRFCVGDVFHVSRALASPQERGLFITQWSADPLVLLDEGPRAFSAIDVSNLADAYGLLNVLTSATPLLESSPTAVIHAETLGSVAGAAVKDFRATLCGEPSAMSLVLGLTPIPYVEGFSTISNSHQIMVSQTLRNDGSSHARIVWQRTPNSNARLHFAAPQDVAVLLHKLYNEMFGNESATAMRAALSTKSASALRRAENICYVRASFITILKAFRARLSEETDWSAVATGFMDLVGNDRLLMLGMNSYQELCLQLHASGLDNSIVPSYHNVGYSIDKTTGPFSGWSDAEIGRTIHVALRVPIAALNKIETLPTAPVLFTVRGPGALNWFSTFVILRGCDVAHNDDEKTFRVVKSPKDDMAVAIGEVPSWILMFAPAETVIAITLRPPTLAGMQVIAALGPHMEIFSAEVLDSQNVFYSVGPPIVVDSPLPPLFAQHEDVHGASDNAPVLSVTLDARKENVTSLMLRFDVQETDAREKWEAKVDVRVLQTSATTGIVETVCGTFRRILDYPLPVDIKNAKLRVARKSFYVEVIATVVNLPMQLSFNMMHRVHLDRLPQLTAHKPQWLNVHGTMVFSDRERSNRERSDGNRAIRLPLVEVKDDIFTMLMRSSGFHNPVRLFVLSDASKPGDGLDKAHAVIFVSSLRLDGGAHTLVADAYVLPPKVTKDALSAGRSIIAGQLTHPSPAAKLWDEMLVAFADRCRVWNHSPTCPQPREYLCSCGAGVDVASFNGPQTLARHATRIAISLPFAPYFLEDVGGHMADFPAGETTGAQVPRSGGGSRTGGAAATTSSSSKPAPAVVGQCIRCGNDAHIMCMKCEKAKYCDKNCQRAHAKAHKASCV